MRIMVIDDSNDILMILERYLKRLEHEPYCYKNPLDAIKNIISVQPELIISDYIMFDMDGIELITKLKKIYPTGIYVLFTSFDDDSLKELCKKLDIIYLNKSGKLNAIKKILEETNVNN